MGVKVAWVQLQEVVTLSTTRSASPSLRTATSRLIMSPFHLVDKDLGVIEAIKQSNDKAIGRMGLVYGAIGVMVLISILASIIGAIPVLGPLVGAGITIAYSLVLALRYQQLKKV